LKKEITMEGSGQNLERRFRLMVWSETTSWAQSRCSDLSNAKQTAEALSLHREFFLGDYE